MGFTDAAEAARRTYQMRVANSIPPKYWKPMLRAAHASGIKLTAQMLLDANYPDKKGV